MLTNRSHSSWMWVAGTLAAGSWLAACADTETGEPVGSGGNGASSGWTFVPPGSGTTSGGSFSASGSGSGSGGVAGKAGSSNGGGGGTGGARPNPVTFKCDHKVPNQPIITSFDGYQADRWKSPGNLDGGGYAYPAALELAMADSLQTEGQIEDYSGLGAWFSGCIDASKYKGVRLSVFGSVGATNSVQFYLITNRTKDVNEADGVGECVPSDPNDAWGSCRPPTVSLPVTGTPTTHSIPWTAFKGGIPGDTTDGSDIIALQWSFVWDDTGNYAAKLSIDDLSFYTDDAPEPGGDGGAGGMPSAEGGAPTAQPEGGSGG